MSKKLGGLQKYSKEAKKKFEGNKPLMEYPNSSYPVRFRLRYRKFEEPKEFWLYDATACREIDLGNRKIIFGINDEDEDFTQYDFLECFDGPAFVVHDRVLKIFNELCPDDFQALPVIIKNNDPKGRQYENKEFWLINILKSITAFDENYVTYSNLGVPQFKKKVIFDDSMKDCLLARDKIFEMKILFHPSLAKHFINSRGVQFLTDEEAPS